MITSSCGLLRIGEGLQLRCCDVALSWTSWGTPLAVFLLGGADAVTKKGFEERVTLTNPHVVGYLKNFHVFPGARATPQERFFRTSYSRLRRLMAVLAACLGVANVGFRSHSLRRGGATELSARRVPFMYLPLFGRWRAERAAREYIRRVEVGAIKLRSVLAPGTALLLPRIAGPFAHLWKMHSRRGELGLLAPGSGGVPEPKAEGDPSRPFGGD